MPSDLSPKRALVRVAGLAALALLAACSAKKPAEPPSDQPHNVVLTAEQRRRISLYAIAPASFQHALDADAVVDFDNDQATAVTAPFSGPVVKLLVEPGQRVRRGQPLAVVDSPDYAAAVGGYQKAAATAANARRIADADKALSQNNGIPQREAQQAQADAAGAEADRAAAFRALASMGGDPRRAGGGAHMLATLRAPIGGTVVERLVTPGQLLQAGTTQAFTVADLSRVWVMAQIPPSDIAAVHVGDRASVDTLTGATLGGTVTNIAQQVNPDTRTFAVRISVDNAGGLLRKQMYVRARIQAARPTSGLLAPVSAVLRDDENLPFVYVLAPDGSFVRRHVTLGERTGDFYAVAEGLQAGDKVVAQGGIFLQFMQNQ